MVSRQPSRTVSILFTDVEGSTELTNTLGDARAREALRVHERVVRDALAAHDGNEVKTLFEGDGFMASFGAATDALAAAIDMQRGMEQAFSDSDTPIRIRIGVNSGEPIEEDGDLHGTAVSRAARIQDQAGGGQIFVSEVVRQLVAGRDFSFTDRGTASLKGFDEPVRRFELNWRAPRSDGGAPLGALADGTSPYKGLRVFEAEDRELFFGREERLAGMLSRLESARLLAVIGASGSGKSSLLRAGLVSSISGGAFSGSGEWPVIVLSPGAHPLDEIATHLSSLGGEASAAAVLRDLEAGPGALDLLSRRLLAQSSPEARFLVVIDQFEELFTLCQDEDERVRFIEELVHAVMLPDGRTTVLLALRADFYGHCAAYSGFAELLENNHALLGPMTEQELRSAIEGPAQLAGLRIEPGLTDLILSDIAREPGSLPLLSHALLETWERRSGRALTLAGYEEAGGVRGAIARTAEGVYGALDEQVRALSRNVFTRLTALGDSTQDTRRRATFHELIPQGDQAAPVEDLVRRLVDARLLTASEDSVEVAHEALIREWPRLREWLNEDREGLRLLRHLTDSAHGWVELGRDAAELYRGARLDAVDDWLGTTTQELSSLEREYLDASLRQRARELHDERQFATLRDRERTEAHQRRALAARAQRLSHLLVGTGVPLAFVLIVGIDALTFNVGPWARLTAGVAAAAIGWRAAGAVREFAAALALISILSLLWPS